MLAVPAAGDGGTGAGGGCLGGGVGITTVSWIVVEAIGGASCLGISGFASDTSFSISFAFSCLASSAASRSARCFLRIRSTVGDYHHEVISINTVRRELLPRTVITSPT